jgi:exodeoxyribonuclease V beta subunit
MRAHRYDLQYLLYTLALHRYLQYRLPEYDYSTHIGPVCYLFLRGMDPQTPESGVFRTLPDPGLIQELDACIRGEAS